MIPLKELPATCVNAKAQFRPITQSDVGQAKTVLLEALGRLDERLPRPDRTARISAKIPSTGTLQEELHAEKLPDKALLDEVHKNYAARRRRPWNWGPVFAPSTCLCKKKYVHGS